MSMVLTELLLLSFKNF